LLNGYLLENEWALESPCGGESGMAVVKITFICLEPFWAVPDVRLDIKKAEGNGNLLPLDC
jgi:hypothetical protein